MTQNNRQIHLGVSLLGAGGLGAWRLPDSRSGEVTSLDLYSDIARKAEQGRLDAVFRADGPWIDVRRVRSAPSASFDPIPLLSAIAARTERIGVIGTISTTFTDPYNVARQLATLDHLSNGRVGWNLVTSSQGEANFGLDKLPDQLARYARAEEYLSVVRALWDSWDDAAVINDRARGVYADPDKIRPIDHKGEHFSVRGPLNIQRPPQGHPVLVQAGSSEEGRTFASKYAELIFTAAQTLEEAQAFYKDIKQRAQGHGRDPDKIKVLPGIYPYIRDTEENARRFHEEIRDLIDIETGISNLEKTLGGIDLSGLDVDERIPPERLPDIDSLTRRKSRPALFKSLALDKGYTIRQLIHVQLSSNGHWSIVGTPEQLADGLETWFRERGADGFNLVLPVYIPGTIDIIVEEVVPILQKRGLFRREYAGRTLRENLGLDRPASPAA
ncbi:MAG: LLM class flavin-dependent oxidoreductase [Pseudochelatococcus sp.]|jgi:FMN-dependent oxidoreductase (nitrilotriacetate monooxygenase family)|uniref:LLM class flavin-dependent oxidoreductase n=1 Tax=Pseudochelatococcus sp. TaxID=2020869 RepID=UPI003D90161C